MPTYSLHQVDAFTTRPLGGNPCAVVFDCVDLNDDTMLAIAREIMCKHPVSARDYLSEVSYLAPALEIPYFHHERWDGTGDPEGLKGKEIPFAARIFALADVWDALTSQRPYRQAWSKEKTLEDIREQSGKHFDPQIVDAFIALTKDQK
jgi:HD-GYP domain-containing protein (c-di-GMP phosphodiesterase class II)